MKSKILKVVLSALLVSGSVYAKMTSFGYNGLSGLADENAASLMTLVTPDCMERKGSICYRAVIDTDDSNPPEAEIIEDWANRTEIVEQQLGKQGGKI